MKHDSNLINFNEDPATEIQQDKEKSENSDQVVLPTVKGDEVLERAKLLDNIIKYISHNFLRRDGRYFLATDTSESYSASDIKHVLATTLPEKFASEHLSPDLIKEAYQTAIVAKHSDPERKVPVWNGKSECRPGQFGSFVFDQGFASINTWICPAYRLGQEVRPNTWHLDVFLARIMPHDQDRVLFKDWLAWCLQNETCKPGWAVFLYSSNKGTGKSTLIELVSQLFGEANSFNCKTVEDVTGRFAAPVFEKKLITIEEVKLQPGTRQANAMKTFITEKKVPVERKGMTMRQIEQSAVFMMTSNHFPSWIEEGERRFFVIEVDHSGHSHGEEREKFVRFIKLFKGIVLENEHALAAIYEGLMTHEVSPEFNPHSLPFERIDTPVMRKLQSASSEVLRDRLEEMLASEDIKAIPQEDLCRLASERIGLAPNRVRHLMFGLGWASEKRKWGGKDYNRTM